MYGNPPEIGSSKTKFRSKGTSDLWRIVAFYFPQISADGSELIFHLTSLLVHFFSSSQGQQFIDQQFRKVCEVEVKQLEEKPKDALLCMNAAVHKVHGMIQELLRSEHHEEGRVPRTVECELTEDLVDTCIPGDVVTVTGIIRVINNYMDIGGVKQPSKLSAFFNNFFLVAVAIDAAASPIEAFLPEDMQHTDTNARATEHSDLYSFSPRDLEFIVKFSEEHGSDVFRQILHSICPSIYGHELVKAGITLALFGGVQKHSRDQNKVPVRGDIHIIVVGDPGLGKSQLLQAAASVAPRGIYVCGNATTNAGLTVAVVKDPLTSDYAFEAGAMVLADRGVCCIDEFDKMSAEYQALLEAMEQQCVSVAKAGLVASLSARTSILAAANPAGGHYNRAKTVNENLKMSAALLSRFDLVFILLDKPDELLDKRLSEHIMSVKCRILLTQYIYLPLAESRDIRGVDMNVKNGSLVAKLRLDPKRDSDLFHSLVLFCVNTLLMQELMYFQADGTPITARQLESLVRLAEARARVDLREEISTQDALDIVHFRIPARVLLYISACVGFAHEIMLIQLGPPPLGE
ncbi:UNVERIFIED_CONTAM: putative DNA helicase MCM8 [Sesamum calycinum]|uniref:DNA helicase n=1 Tax=Sesamum calycinum TaxID=2727403 RepID=A0AAW2NVJ8_9LAMI